MSEQQTSKSWMTFTLKCLSEMGWVHNAVLADGKLRCNDTQESYEAEALALQGSFRFEGQSDPEDMSVIYALQAVNGTKLLVIDAFGPYGDPLTAGFMESVKDERTTSQLMEHFPPAHTIKIESTSKIESGEKIHAPYISVK